jgi:hypothetical protein
MAYKTLRRCWDNVISHQTATIDFSQRIFHLGLDIYFHYEHTENHNLNLSKSTSTYSNSLSKGCIFYDIKPDRFPLLNLLYFPRTKKVHFWVHILYVLDISKRLELVFVK